MSLSSQEVTLNKSSRSNQKARTRAALLQAATELFLEGGSPSMSEAAGRALVSVATAYRYFSSAEDLWWEAATRADVFQQTLFEALARTGAAGSEPQARLEAAVRSEGSAVLDQQAPFRRVAQLALQQWFQQRETDDGRQMPTPVGRRNEVIEEVLSPLVGRLPEQGHQRIAHALGLVFGTEAVIALTDAVGLDPPAAQAALLDAGRWILAGALAELTDTPPTDRGSEASGGGTIP